MKSRLRVVDCIWKMLIIIIGLYMVLASHIDASIHGFFNFELLFPVYKHQRFITYLLFFLLSYLTLRLDNIWLFFSYILIKMKWC